MVNPLVKVLKRFYEQGVYDVEKVRLFLTISEITLEEFKEITGGM